MALKSMLDGIEHKSPVILITSRGMPWKKRNFARRWDAPCVKAGSEGLRCHDLRGTPVTMLSEAGCAPQIMATLTGHCRKSATAILGRNLAHIGRLVDAAIALFQNSKATELENRPQTSTQREQNGDTKRLK